MYRHPPIRQYVFIVVLLLGWFADSRPATAACCSLENLGATCTPGGSDTMTIGCWSRTGVTNAFHVVTNTELWIDGNLEDDTGLEVAVYDGGQWDCPSGGSVESFAKFYLWANWRNLFPDGGHSVFVVVDISSGTSCTTHEDFVFKNCP